MKRETWKVEQNVKLVIFVRAVSTYVGTVPIYVLQYQYRTYLDVDTDNMYVGTVPIYVLQ